jgi:hypothetical protein
LGSKASGLELCGAYKAAENLRSTCIGVWTSRSHGSGHGGRKSSVSESCKVCLLVLGYLEPWQLQAQGNHAFGQQKSWGLLSRHGLQEGSAVVLQA